MNSISKYKKFLYLSFIVQIFFLLDTIIHEYTHIFAANMLSYDTQFKYNKMTYDQEPILNQLDSLYKVYDGEIMNNENLDAAKEYFNLKEKIQTDELIISLSAPLVTIFLGIISSILFIIRRYKYKNNELELMDIFYLIISLNLSRNAYFIFSYCISYYFTGKLKWLKSLDEYTIMIYYNIDVSIIIVILGLISGVFLFINYIYFLVLKYKKYAIFLVIFLSQIFSYIFWDRFVLMYLSYL